MSAAGRFTLALMLALGGGGAIACTHRDPASAEPAPESPNALERRGAEPLPVVLNPETRAAIRVETLRDREQTATLTLAGKVQFDEDRLAHVLAPVAGQIVQLRVKVGDRVRKAEVLCAISSREAAAAIGERIEAHKDLDLAEKTAAMTEDLFTHQAASRIAFQQAQNELAKARSRVARNDEVLRVLGLSASIDAASLNGRVPIPAPLTGTVIERRMTEGQFVQSDSTPIITIADLSTVWVLGDIFERDLHLVDRGRSAVVSTSAYPGERFEGRVAHISDVIDPATRTAKVRVSVPNPAGRLKPEMFASIVLGVGDPARVLIVPSRATFSEDGRTWVYLATGDNGFVRRAVELGPDEGADRRVIAGLRAGDQVVVDGALLLRQREEKRPG